MNNSGYPDQCLAKGRPSPYSLHPFTAAGSVSLLIGSLLISQPLLADETRHYQIPAQSLNNALTKFASEAKLILLFNSEQIRGINSRGLDGDLTPEQALRQMLQDTGYRFRFVDAHTVTLEKAEPANPPSPAESSTLPAVKVVGKTIYDATDPYNQDYTLPSTITGTKTDTPFMETPLNVQVVSKQVLKDQQAFTLDKALKNVSGVTSTVNAPAGGGVSNTFTIRGFESDTYFRNGFRIVGSSAGVGGIGTRQFANVESVEVLKGPAAILYGRVEPGGMVNLVTKQPLSKPYYSIQQQIGSYDLYRTSADATGPVTADKSWLYRMNLSYESSASFREFVDNDRLFLAPVIQWEISPRTKATFEMEYTRDAYGFDLTVLPVINNKIVNLPRSRNLGEPLTNKTETYFGSATLSHQFNDDWSIKQSISVNRVGANQNVLYYLGFDQANALIDRVPVKFIDMTANYAANMDLTGHFDTGSLRHTLLLGGDYYRLDYGLTGFGFSPAKTYPINPFDPNHSGGGIINEIDHIPAKTNQFIDQYGFYLQDQIKLPYDFQFLGGFRYQYIHQTGSSSYGGISNPPEPTLTDDAATPRFGLLWQPRSWLSLYSNYAENFGANPGITVDQKALPPTTAQQWEVGAKTEFFNGRLQATMAYYDLSKQNVATTDPAHPSFNIAIGEVRSRGPEIDIRGEPFPGWNIIATYANQDVRVTKSESGDQPVGSRMRLVPRNVGSLWNTYEFHDSPLKGLKLGGGVTLQDQTVDSHNIISNPGYATMDLMAAYSLKLGHSKLTAQFNVNNLLDKHVYSTSVVESNQAYGSYLTPRTVMGSINLQY